MFMRIFFLLIGLTSGIVLGYSAKEDPAPILHSTVIGQQPNFTSDNANWPYDSYCTTLKEGLDVTAAAEKLGSMKWTPEKITVADDAVLTALMHTEISKDSVDMSSIRREKLCIKEPLTTAPKPRHMVNGELSSID